MPTMPMTKMPAELRQSSMESDAATDRLATAASPFITASAAEIKLLIDSVNQVLALIPNADPISFEPRDLDSEALPPDLLRALVLINKVAQVTETGGVSVDVIGNTGGLRVVAMEVQALAKDKDFRRGLKMPTSSFATELKAPAPTPGVPTLDEEPAGPSADDRRKTLMGRM